MIKRLFISYLLNAAALFGLIYFFPEIRYTGGVAFFVVAGGFMTIINMVLKPILKIMALPFLIISGGLFMILINAFLLAILRYMLDVVQFRDVHLVVSSKGSYLIAGLVFGLLNWILNAIFKR